MKRRIIIDDKIPFIRGVFESYADVRYLSAPAIEPASVRDADMLIVRTRTRCDAALLDGSRCRFVGTATIGYDHIDTAYCRRQGIVWCNAPGCNAASVAQYITASLLRHAEKTGCDLRDRCIGIVGVGHVGRQVEAHCRRLGMRVLLNDPPRAEAEGATAFVSLDTIARECDYITFHTPLTRDGAYPSYHLADEEFFSSLCRRPVILNAARGEVVDNAALEAAYDAGRVSDMILDCWENEPAPSQTLLQKAFIATPHIAGYSADGKANATRMIVAAAARHLGIEIDTSTIQPPAPPVACLDMQDVAHPLAKAVWAAYDPLDDTHDLKNAPAAFESLRGHYRLRREFGAYTLTHVPESEVFYLSSWGFAISK